MARYDTSDLHHRQAADEVGHAVLGSTGRSTANRRRVLLLPAAVVVLGFLLSMWGPLPGLGVLLVIGGVMGLVISAMLLLTDGFS